MGGGSILCYRDRTWCSFYKDCADPCWRALTDELKLKAEASGLPVCQFVDKPPCWVDKYQWFVKRLHNSHMYGVYRDGFCESVHYNKYEASLRAERLKEIFDDE